MRASESGISASRGLWRLFFTALIALWLTATMTLSNRAMAAEGVNGESVTNVVFGQRGQQLGQFRQTGPGRWRETQAASSNGGFEFEETGRDEWSVYLFDRSRNVRIQLDLHRKLVLYDDGAADDMRPLYEILAVADDPVHGAAASPTPPVSPPVVPTAPAALGANGRNVTLAVVGQQGRQTGEFRQTGRGRWEERSVDPGARPLQFQETGRDDWSVYLFDPSRNVKIQIDLYRKQILYAAPGKPSLSPIYDVLAASSPPVPADAVHVDDFGGRQPTDPGTSGGGNNAQSGKEFCWKDSYGRGVGTMPQSCPAGRERIGLLCYTQCPANTQRFGFDCHSVCPSGMRNDGLFCRAAEYGRGVGFPWEFGDALNDNGMIKRCERAHGRGNCEKNGLIYYPKCKAGYSAVGCCLCRPNVPNCAALGMNPGIDLSCAKRVIIGDPVTGSCPYGEESDGGLCYKQCRPGYDGVGPVCWTGAPRGWVECGMGAAKDSATCAQIVFGQVQSVGQLAFNVATLGSGSAASGASSASRLATLKQKYRALTEAYERAKPAMEAAFAAKSAAGAAINTVNLIDENNVTEEDIVRISAEIAAVADPTGVAGAVASYTYPTCSKYGFPVP